MQLEIHAKGFALTDALHAYARARLSFALDRLRRNINHVVVRLTDINGPRGGRDKRCQIQIGAADGSDVIVADTREDLYAAIDSASERASRSLTRRLSRRLSRRRPSMPAVDDQPADPS